MMRYACIGVESFYQPPRLVIFSPPKSHAESTIFFSSRPYFYYHELNIPRTGIGMYRVQSRFGGAMRLALNTTIYAHEETKPLVEWLRQKPERRLTALAVGSFIDPRKLTVTVL